MNVHMKNDRKLSEKDVSLINKYKFYIQFEKGLSENSIAASDETAARKRSSLLSFYEFFY